MASERDPADVGRIVSDPGVMSGHPRMAGTRIWPDMARGFGDVDKVLAAYPDLDRVDALVMIAYCQGQDSVADTLRLSLADIRELEEWLQDMTRRLVAEVGL